MNKSSWEKFKFVQAAGWESIKPWRNKLQKYAKGNVEMSKIELYRDVPNVYREVMIPRSQNNSIPRSLRIGYTVKSQNELCRVVSQ